MNRTQSVVPGIRGAGWSAAARTARSKEETAGENWPAWPKPRAHVSGWAMVDPAPRKPGRYDLSWQREGRRAKALVQATDADVILFDNDLSPAQTRNLEQAAGTKVLDRSELILDIFASRAPRSRLDWPSNWRSCNTRFPG